MCKATLLSPLHYEVSKQGVLMGIWRVTGSTRLQSLAVRRGLGGGIAGCEAVESGQRRVRASRSMADNLPNPH
eukprot:72849-Pelagomonas_calceolata.AAC.1